MPGTLVISDLSDGTNSTSATNLVRGPCVAWVNFDGTGTVAIRASYNVSSITDNGTGDYTINFTNALANANYVLTGMNNDGNGFSVHGANGTTAPTTTAQRIFTRNQVSNSLQDSPWISIAVFNS